MDEHTPESERRLKLKKLIYTNWSSYDDLALNCPTVNQLNISSDKLLQYCMRGSRNACLDRLTRRRKTNLDPFAVTNQQSKGECRPYETTIRLEHES